MRKLLSVCLAALTALSAAGSTAVHVSGENLEISADSAVVIEAETGRVVYEKNAYQQRPMASTTKIMTTMLALEQPDLDEYFTVDSEAVKVEGSSMGLTEGDRVTLRTLCYGMMLPSGNDAANCTAVRVAGSIPAFVEMMNRRAEELGLKDTHFVTPSGLDDYTDEHYSTAYDMAVLTAQALKDPEFVEICSSKTAKLCYGDPPYDRWLSNNNKLLKYCDGVFGVKTGFTDKARRCLVTACKRNGVTLICVTLNAPSDWNDHAALYDYAFQKVKSYVLPMETQQFNVNVVGGEKDFVAVRPEETPTASLFDGELERIVAKTTVAPFYYAPIICGEKLGRVDFYLDGELIRSADLLAQQDISVKQRDDSSVVMKYIRKIRDLISRFF